jgi:hypothetical protein
VRSVLNEAMCQVTAAATTARPMRTGRDRTSRTAETPIDTHSSAITPIFTRSRIPRRSR